MRVILDSTSNQKIESISSLTWKLKKAFDPNLCLVCQDPKQDRPQKKDMERFKVFVEVCKTFENTEYKVSRASGNNQK